MHDFCIPERDQYKSVVSDELIDLRRNPRLISMKSLWALILNAISYPKSVLLLAWENSHH